MKDKEQFTTARLTKVQAQEIDNVFGRIFGTTTNAVSKLVDIATELYKADQQLFYKYLEQIK